MWEIFLSLSLILWEVAALPKVQRTGYSEMEARKLLNLAAGAYAEDPHECLARTFATHEERRLLPTVKEECDAVLSLCSGYAVQSDKLQEMIIVFRGTKTKIQLFVEGWQSMEPGVDFFGMGNVNRYFLHAHLTLWPTIERTLADPKYKHYSVVFTGHSLGGALASLAAARAVKQGFRQGGQVRLVTFGQPRVGGVQFAREFDRMIPNAYRVVFRRDIVSHLPTCHKDRSNRSIADGESFPCDQYIGTQSYHHGKEIWYPDCMEENCNYVECLGEPKNEDFECSDHIKFKFNEASSYIWDHRHYFGVKVTDHGKTGCDGVWNATAENDVHKKAVTTVIAAANWLAKKIGLN